MAEVIWNKTKLILLLVLPALLAACGGGGSGQNPPPDGDGGLTFDVVDGRPVARIGNQVFQLLTEEEVRISQELHRQALEAQEEEEPPQGQAAQPLSLPPRVDLKGHQTDIRHQGERNTCAAFAAVAVLEAAYKRDRGMDLDLSEQYVHQVNKMAWLHRDPNPVPPPLPRTEQQIVFWAGGGVPVLLFLRHYGVPLESFMPYVANSPLESIRTGDTQWEVDQVNLEDRLRPVPNNPSLVFERLPLGALLNAQYAPTTVKAIELNLRAFKEALARGETIGFGARLPCTESGEFTPQGVWRSTRRFDRSPGTGCGAHAMAIVGYDDSLNAFLVKNSLGKE